MAVTYIDSTTTGNTALTSSRAVPVPVGTAVDDVVVVRLSRWESINPAVTLPGGGTGWVSRTQVVNGSGKIDTYLKRLTAADSGTYTFSWTGSMWTTGQATLYRGVDPAANLATVSLTSATNTGTAWPAVTLSSVADGVLDWHGYSESGGTHTPPTGWTEVEDNDSDDSAYQIITAGSYTTSGGASSVSSPNMASMLHLPAATGGGSNFTQTPTDNEGLADTQIQDLGKVAADPEGLTDAAALTQAKATAESIGLTDSASVSFVLDRTAADALGLTDSSVVVRGAGVSAPDNLDLTDSAVLDTAQAVSEVLGLSDVATVAHSVPQAATDNLGLADATTQALGQSQGDLVGLSDSVAIQASGAASLAPADSEGLTDATALSRSQSSSDSEALTDTAAVGLGRDRTAADSLGLSDQVTLVVTRDLGDVLNLSDTAALVASFVRVLQEVAGLTDTTQVSLTGPTSGITVRPTTGTTTRPGSGITPRPFTGTTVRPG